MEEAVNVDVETLDRLIADLKRDGMRLEGPLSDGWRGDMLFCAVRFLEELLDWCDAQIAPPDEGLAEVGRIVRKQRQRIAFLERELAAEKKRADRLEDEAKARWRREKIEEGIA